MMIDTERCACCGRKGGNLLSDNSQEGGRGLQYMTDEELKIARTEPYVKYGYLCAKCYRFLKDSAADLARLRKMVAYIERTRNGSVTCKSCGEPIQQTGSPRKRVYCNSACKQREYRSRIAKVTVA